MESFVQPPMVREPDGLMDNFEPLDAVPSVKSVTELMEKDTDSEMVLRKHLLTGLSDSRTGLYSMFHENTIWQYGYNHPNTIRNAFMSVAFFVLSADCRSNTKLGSQRSLTLGSRAWS